MAGLLQAADLSNLVGRQHLGHDPVDTDLGADGFSGPTIVPGEQHHLETEGMEFAHRLRTGDLETIGHGDDARGRKHRDIALAEPDDHRGSSGPLGLIDSVEQCSVDRCEQRWPTDTEVRLHAVGGHLDGGDATPRDVGEIDHLSPDRRTGVLTISGGQDGPGDRMLGAGFDCGGRGQHHLGAEIPGGEDVDNLHAALGERSGLVENSDIHASGLLQHLAALDDDAELGAASGPDHDRSGCGEAERAGAGDDEHGDCGAEHVVRVMTGDGPARECEHGDAEHDRHEHTGDSIGEALDGSS